MTLVTCRACLVMKMNMYSMLDTEIQATYVNIVGVNVQTEDGKPSDICLECYTQLMQCHEFKEKCLRSEEILTELHSSLIKVDEIGGEIKRDCPNPESEIKDETNEVDNVTYEDAACDSDDDIPLKEIRRRAKFKKKMKRKKTGGGNEIQEIQKKVEVRRGFKEDYAVEIKLTKEQQLEEMAQRAFSLNYLNSPYKCTLCYKGFIDKLAFSNHQQKHDKINGELECELCHLRYVSQRQLRTHLTTAHNRVFACKTCSHRSHTANQAREHEKWHRGYVYECKLCGDKFLKPTSHLTHMRKRHATEFICELCGDTFLGRHGLLMHRTKSHRTNTLESCAEKNPESYCADCDVQFASVEAWRWHIITSLKHTSDNSCQICKRQVADGGELARHLRGHGREARARDPARAPPARRLACDQCDSQFANRSKLQAHVKRKHLGVKYNKNIVCEVCGKKCTSNATLRYHQRTHTGERPCACAACPKRFADANQLRIHARTHSGERPYACALCRRAFRQKPALNRHMRVHTGVKPYQCQYCAKTFTQSNSLKLHVNTVHLKLPSNNRRKVNPPVADKPVIDGVVLQSL